MPADFPIPFNDRRISYTAVGGEVNHAFDFPIFDDEDMNVYRTRAGSTSTLTLTTDYTVTVNTDQEANPGGIVTLVTAALASDVHLIVGSTTLDRESDFQQRGGWRASEVNEEFDRIIMMLQEMKAVGVSFDESFTGTVGTISPAGVTSGLFLRRTPTGYDHAAVVSAGSISIPVAIADGGTGGITANAALTNLTATRSETGAVAVPALTKLRDHMSVRDFGAVGDGVTDDTTAISNACTALGTAGGTVHIPDSFRCLVDSNLTIPVNVSLKGPHEFVGTPGDNVTADYSTMGGALIVNSAATITQSSNSSLHGLLIHRKGMTFPAADSSAFAGTAITIGGNDVGVSHCLILGFAQAITSTSRHRQKIDYVSFDCTAGISITGSNDTLHIKNCHGWPFATIATFEVSGVNSVIQRGGTAFLLTTCNDWGKLTDCFSFGYLRGFKITDSNAITLTGCGADDTSNAGTPDHASSAGFEVNGTSKEVRLIGCQAAAKATAGFIINTSAGFVTHMLGCNSWVCTTQAIALVAGDLNWIGCTHRSSTNGITVSSTASRVMRSNNRFDTITTPLNCAAGVTLMFGGGDDFATLAAGTAPASANMILPTVASATPLNLPATGEAFNVTGNTGWTLLAGGHAGRRVTLFFASTPTLTNGTGATGNMRLSGAANFVATAGSTISLMHNGVQWFEVGRSA